MRLAFRQSAPLALVRAFLADLVRLVRPEITGDWAHTGSTSPPTESPNDSIERTEWQLGEAKLTQTIDKHGGNPREADDYQLTLDLSVHGADGVARKVSLYDGTYEAQPKELRFVLVGFTADEFLRARKAGRARFTNDDTAHPMSARENIEACIKAGAPSTARALAEEALNSPNPAWDFFSRRAVQRSLFELTDDLAARAVEEGQLLRGDPTDTDRLARVASGALVLPQWPAGAAARVLAVMQPWRPSASLAEVADRWLDHPWWRPARGSTLRSWSSLRRQHYGGTLRNLTPEGEPRPLPVMDAVAAVQKTLGLGEVGAAICGPAPQATEGRILSLEGDVVRVRAMAYFRERTEAFEHHWTWLWTGEGLEGAVVVTRVAPPFDLKASPVETMVTWLGGAARFEKNFLETNENLRLL